MSIPESRPPVPSTSTIRMIIHPAQRSPSRLAFTAAAVEIPANLLRGKAYNVKPNILSLSGSDKSIKVTKGPKGNPIEVDFTSLPSSVDKVTIVYRLPTFHINTDSGYIYAPSLAGPFTNLHSTPENPIQLAVENHLPESLKLYFNKKLIPTHERILFPFENTYDFQSSGVIFKASQHLKHGHFYQLVSPTFSERLTQFKMRLPHNAVGNISLANFYLMPKGRGVCYTAGSLFMNEYDLKLLNFKDRTTFVSFQIRARFEQSLPAEMQNTILPYCLAEGLTQLIYTPQVQGEPRENTLLVASKIFKSALTLNERMTLAAKGPLLLLESPANITETELGAVRKFWYALQLQYPHIDFVKYYKQLGYQKLRECLEQKVIPLPATTAQLALDQEIISNAFSDPKSNEWIRYSSAESVVFDKGIDKAAPTPSLPIGLSDLYFEQLLALVKSKNMPEALELVLQGIDNCLAHQVRLVYQKNIFSGSSSPKPALDRPLVDLTAKILSYVLTKECASHHQFLEHILTHLATFKDRLPNYAPHALAEDGSSLPNKEHPWIVMDDFVTAVAKKVQPQMRAYIKRFKTFYNKTYADAEFLSLNPEHAAHYQFYIKALYMFLLGCEDSEDFESLMAPLNRASLNHLYEVSNACRTPVKQTALTKYIEASHPIEEQMRQFSPEFVPSLMLRLSPFSPFEQQLKELSRMLTNFTKQRNVPVTQVHFFGNIISRLLRNPDLKIDQASKLFSVLTQALSPTFIQSPPFTSRINSFIFYGGLLNPTLLPEPLRHLHCQFICYLKQAAANSPAESQLNATLNQTLTLMKAQSPLNFRASMRHAAQASFEALLAADTPDPTSSLDSELDTKMGKFYEIVTKYSALLSAGLKLVARHKANAAHEAPPESTAANVSSGRLTPPEAPRVQADTTPSHQQLSAANLASRVVSPLSAKRTSADRDTESASERNSANPLAAPTGTAAKRAAPQRR